MRRIQTPMAATAWLVLCASCGPAGPRVPGARPPSGITGDEVRVEQAPPSILSFPSAQADDLWRALPAAFEQLGIPAGVMDGRSRIYGNPEITASSIAGERVRSMFRCTNAGAGMASLTQYRIEFGIAVQPRTVADGGSELIVQTQALGRLMDPSRSGAIHCVSNGTIEGKLKQQIGVELEGLRRSSPGAD